MAAVLAAPNGVSVRIYGSDSPTTRALLPGCGGGGLLTSVFVIPVICREDFASFARDLGLASKQTFEDWSKLLAGELAEARAQGKTIIEAEVRYAEFSEYCAKRSRKPDAMLLLEFVSRPKPLSEA